MIDTRLGNDLNQGPGHKPFVYSTITKLTIELVWNELSAP